MQVRHHAAPVQMSSQMPEAAWIASVNTTWKEEPPSLVQPTHRKGNYFCLFLATKFWCGLLYSKRTVDIPHYRNQKQKIVILKTGALLIAVLNVVILISSINNLGLFSRRGIILLSGASFFLNMTWRVSHILKLCCSKSLWLRLPFRSSSNSNWFSSVKFIKCIESKHIPLLYIPTLAGK